MPNRYCRDELITIALSMAQLPNLEIHDAPLGIVQTDAYCIQWLQDILDFWYHMVPFSSTITDVSLNISASSSSVVLPTDFILDVRNGYLVQRVVSDINSYHRTIRVPLQKWLNRSLISQNNNNNVLYPRYYMIQGSSLRVTPTPSVSVVGKLWYYQLPAVLHSNDIPLFPNDYVCIEYIRIRALEWARIYEPGTAHKFCEKVVAGMKAAGLMNETEDDEIPFDDLVYSKGGSGRGSSWAWMGDR